MSLPVITARNSDNTEEITTLSFGAVERPGNSDTIIINIWNNYGGTENIDDAEGCALAIKTFNLLNEGDTTPNGQEIVTEKYITAKCISRGDIEFLAIGGSTTLPIGYTSGSRVLKGSIADPDEQFCTVELKLVAPSGATSSNVQFKLLVVKE